MSDKIQSESLNLLRPTEKGGSGEIDQTNIFLNEISALCMSKEFSDVTFKIQDENIPGHVNILATRSKYFRALLCGGFSDLKHKVIQLKVPIEAFKALLTFMYSGYLSLSQMREENIFDTLVLVNQCGCTELELRISEYFGQMLSLDNVCSILNTAKKNGLKTLQKSCHTFLDANANAVLLHKSFKNLSEEALKDTIRRDTFCAPEYQIFFAVSEWSKHNSNVAIEPVVSLIRLPLMNLEQLLGVEQFYGIFDSDTLLKAIKEKTTSISLPYRKGSWPEKNVATEKFGARVIQGESGSTLLDGDTTSYDLHKGFAQHRIIKDNDLGIIVELGSVTVVNHIKLLLLDRDSRSYFYFVDVSVDKTQWERVVDHQSFHCRSWQLLYFPSKDVRYIKVVGTYGSVQSMFEVVSLEAYYTSNVPKMINGVVAPIRNVATNEMGAAVINGYSPHYLLNGDIKSYSLGTGYTSHTIGLNSIVVQLSQPYVIGSMRLLLWDCDGRKYSFYIETSINHKNWSVVVDKKNEICRSWQNIVFKPRPMVFIKIVGTRNTANNCFHCVHFECPSQKLNTDDCFLNNKKNCRKPKKRFVK